MISFLAAYAYGCGEKPSARKNHLRDRTQLISAHSAVVDCIHCCWSLQLRSTVTGWLPRSLIRFQRPLSDSLPLARNCFAPEAFR